MTTNEFKLRVESLIDSNNYWLKNNILNFINDLIKLDIISKKKKNELLTIQNEVLLIKDSSIKKFLDADSKKLLKEKVIKIKQLFLSKT